MYHASEVRRRLEELSRGIAVAVDIRSDGRHVSIDTRVVAPLFLREEKEEEEKTEEALIRERQAAGGQRIRQTEGTVDDADDAVPPMNRASAKYNLSRRA